MPLITEILQAETWVLDGTASTPPIEAGTATLRFEADRVHGSSPCNTYMGTFELDGDSISFGPLASTMMACQDDLMTAERVYLTSLAAVDTVTLEDGTVTLFGDGVSLVFDAVDLDEVLVGTWSIVSVATGDAITTVLVDTEPTITFDEDGNVLVTTGCNSGGTTWERDGNALSFGNDVDTTAMGCEGDLADQEDAIFAAIRATRTFDIAPGQLTLLDGDGHIVLTALPADS
jgi:heat shock protein HslJ